MKSTLIKALMLPLLFISGACLSKDEAPLTPSAIFIAGDSTAASYTNADHQGWGEPFKAYFDADKVTVDNRARGGRSSRTFITEGLWQALIDDVRPGDVVIIQFGHNDGSPVNDDRRARGTLPGIGSDHIDIVNQLTGKQERVFSFGHYIRQMVAEVKAKQAVPVLASLSVRNLWQEHRIERGSGQYGYWMYQLAWELGTPYIDLTNAAADALELLGKEGVAALYPKDHTHYHNEGADLHAQLMVSALKGLRPSLDNTVYSDKGRAVTPYDWTFVRLPVVPDVHRRSVFMVGDSTVRNGWGDGRDGQWGWGDFVDDWLGNPPVNFVNRAVGGLSSRTFITQGHWLRALNMMKPGDIVLIQFGHNDAGALNDDSRARGTIKGIGYEQVDIDNMLTGERETVYTYGSYLRQMIGEARARGVIPVICSPVPRKVWLDDAPRIARAENSYPQWAAQVARQSQTSFIDLHTLVAARYDELGPQRVDAMFGDERTHTSKAGAIDTAGIVAQQLAPMLGLAVVDSVAVEDK
ncbi:rhamnogalacturonan acetylesterase [Aestuariibacter sp. GS-14]|uniref:rhamnogalacturonan acetylesterase n=1 Tax=Aestuariibacter sp. GS-14 TaxID=2590670 RepID=UPI001126621E|nr:rhamnogalacturonan acetylesterase [Aestuariibacter sp. GS-14]TPV59173.1 rhamnogalacturonan acetylesterase [Aestuariibacter sp. GS-14]